MRGEATHSQPWRCAAVAPQSADRGPAVSCAAAARVSGSSSRGASTTMPVQSGTTSPPRSAASTPSAAELLDEINAPVGTVEAGDGEWHAVHDAARRARSRTFRSTCGQPAAMWTTGQRLPRRGETPALTVAGCRTHRGGTPDSPCRNARLAASKRTTHRGGTPDSPWRTPDSPWRNARLTRGRRVRGGRPGRSARPGSGRARRRGGRARRGRRSARGCRASGPVPDHTPEPRHGAGHVLQVPGEVLAAARLLGARRRLRADRRRAPRRPASPS